MAHTNKTPVVPEPPSIPHTNPYQTNTTINRAELCGAVSALDFDTTDPLHPLPLTLFLDSLVALYIIQAALHAPHCLTEMKHAPLQLYIASLILARARLGYSTHLQKVPSHSGTTGNDRADCGDNQALLSPDTCDFTMDHIDNQHLASLPA